MAGQWRCWQQRCHSSAKRTGKQHGAAVALLALMGVVTSAVIKYHGNVARVLASSCAVHLSTLLSHLVSGFTPTRHFLAAAALCQMAILLYNKSLVWPPPQPHLHV